MRLAILFLALLPTFAFAEFQQKKLKPGTVIEYDQEGTLDLAKPPEKSVLRYEILSEIAPIFKDGPAYRVRVSESGKTEEMDEGYMFVTDAASTDDTCEVADRSEQKKRFTNVWGQRESLYLPVGSFATCHVVLSREDGTIIDAWISEQAPFTIKYYERLPKGNRSTWIQLKSFTEPK